MSDIFQYLFWKKLQQLPFVEKIVLYGSRARGDHQERSDIDLAVFCPIASEKDWHQVMDIVENADTLLKIDCVRLDKLSETNPLLASIKRDGKIIYSKKVLS